MSRKNISAGSYKWHADECAPTFLHCVAAKPWCKCGGRSFCRGTMPEVPTSLGLRGGLGLHTCGNASRAPRHLRPLALRPKHMYSPDWLEIETKKHQDKASPGPRPSIISPLMPHGPGGGTVRMTINPLEGPQSPKAQYGFFDGQPQPDGTIRPVSPPQLFSLALASTKVAHRDGTWMEHLAPRFEFMPSGTPTKCTPGQAHSRWQTH